MTPIDDLAQPSLVRAREEAAAQFRAGRFADAAAAYRRILTMMPGDFDASRKLGLLAVQGGRIEEGRKLLEAALSRDPSDAETWLHHGMALQQLGLLKEAAASYERALRLKPDYAEALFTLGVTLRGLGRTDEAIARFSDFIALRRDQPNAYLHRGDLRFEKGEATAALADYEAALLRDPDHVESWIHRGAVLTESGRPEEALASFEEALGRAPNRGEIWYNRGLALEDLGRNEDAFAAYERATALDPNLSNAWCNRGNLLRKQGKPDEALASYDKALAIDPRHLQALTNRGAVLGDLHRFEESLASHDEVLALKSDSAEGWYNRGAVLRQLGQDEEALQAYEKSLAINPSSANAWNNRGNLLRKVGKPDDALASYARALAIDPRHADALANKGAALQTLKRFAEAEREFRKLERAEPQHKYLLGGLAISAQALCDWEELEGLRPRLEADALSGRAIVPPFVLLAFSSDPVLHRVAARHFLADLVGPLPQATRPTPAPHDKIRLAYVSADFHDHATAYLIAGLIERHDRERFEVIGISFDPDIDSPMRSRLKAAFDRFVDVRDLSDAEAARLMREMQIDIAVDLKGYTQNARPGIFARRAAPVQVNYLGYPGTMAADFIDYVIADRIVLPHDRQPVTDERIVHLPHSYQVNDPGRIMAETPSRKTAGLPEKGFVFCSFNNHWKITRPVFESWMRLLAAVPGSVLWLIAESATENLRAAATESGVDPARIIFAPRIAQAEHLARLKLADLVLDTLPYNAHTTGSDALWAGVPLLTARGAAFPGRVAESLLAAVGLSELVAGDLQSYEALALALANDPARLAELRAKLVANRKTAPLFDADRFRRDIEAAFAAMAEAARRGDAAEPFDVPA